MFLLARAALPLFTMVEESFFILNYHGNSAFVIPLNFFYLNSLLQVPSCFITSSSSSSVAVDAVLRYFTVSGVTAWAKFNQSLPI